MEAPHHIHWHAANPELPVGEKEGIIRAYECLHAHGILHNSISFHNIFIGQDPAQNCVQDSSIYNHNFRSRYECYTGKLSSRMLLG
jgi:hypothetical protein